MSFTFRFHTDTEKDYSEAYEWYEDKLAGLGERFIKAVRKKVEEIAEHPQTFGRRINKGYREAQVDFFLTSSFIKCTNRRTKSLSVLFIIPRNIQEESIENRFYKNNAALLKSALTNIDM